MTQCRKQNLKKIISFVSFICIALFIFTRVTYLFREVSCSRDIITGFEEEENLDVIFIGSSTVVEYYQPLTAWKEYGYTSYSYGTLYGQIDLYWRYMDRVLQTHEPELFVIDLRMLTTLSGDVYEQGLRFWADSLPVFSKDRYLSVKDYLERHTLDENANRTSYYFDIAKYHTNSSALASPDNWKYLNNKGCSKYKGYELSSVHHFFDEPDIETEEKAELSPMQSEVLYQLLDYCKEKELNVLFVICPYILSEDEQKVYNTAKEIVTSYGYNYINANEYYDEINLDFTTDMKNINHVNCVGAEKYTKFLAEYIVQTYEIPKHRDDASYAHWNEVYETFAESLEQEKENVYQAVERKYEAANLSQYLSECDNIYEWYSGARNDNFTVIVNADLQKHSFEKIDAQGRHLLEQWGIDTTGSNHYLRISCGEDIIFREENAEAIDYSGVMGVVDGLGQVHYKVHIDEGVSLLIGEEEYYSSDDGIYIILFDNNFKMVVDSMALYVNDDGAIEIKRM